MKPVLLLLLGSSGTGKSALASAIKRGERCLVKLPLPERIWSGTVVNASNSKCVYNIACAHKVTEILPSKMQPPYRKVWKMSRVSA